MEKLSDYSKLTPDLIVQIVEDALGTKLTGYTYSHPSYINRVYELETTDYTRLIAKFYRPGRWSLDAIKEEHEFTQDCKKDEIPVIEPLTLSDGNTLGVAYNFPFAVFPKKQGRQFELNSLDDYKRVGAIIARMHLAGSRKNCNSRLTLSAQTSLKSDLDYLWDSQVVSPIYEEDFFNLCDTIYDKIDPLFENIQLQSGSY